MRTPINYQIPEREISFHPHSYGDPDGRLFWWNGQLYRAISQEKTPFFRQLFRGRVVQDLMDRGVLVPSEPTELSLYGYGMVVRHGTVPFVSYPQEWCAAMFKDAALAYLDLVSELVPLGLMLKDTHPWNLLFDGSKPVYVDLTSIRPITEHSSCVVYDKFCRYYLYPLMLMSQGQERIARHLLPDYEGILHSDFSLLTRKSVSSASLPSKKNRFTMALEGHVPEAYRNRLKNGFRSIQSLLQKQSPGQNSQLDYLKRIRSEIENVPLPPFRAQAADSEANWIPPPQNTWAMTQQSLHNIISEICPASILAIGAKWRECSGFLALAGNRVVTFDNDAACVTEVYCDARGRNLPLLPLVMDFADPTPSRGLASHLSIAATERLRCEMVVALGLANQLISERYLRFDQIVEGLGQFSKRWLLIDLVPHSMYSRDLGIDSCYTAETFIHALRKAFSHVRLFSCESQSHRLLLCEK
jgi:hypothetical protein